MKINEVINYLESIAPPNLQEDYDNSGLIVGNRDNTVNGILICLDSTEEIINEAIEKNCNLIIAHHPIVFSGLKKITSSNYIEKTIIKAIKNDINIYAIHTNLDNIINGVNSKIANLLKLQNIRILKPKKNQLLKISVFAPKNNADKIRDAMFDAGAGNIGNYSNCSFNTEGQGTFMANKDSKPYVGKENKIHFEKEIKIEVIVPVHLKNNVIKQMIKAHPYEEVAYDIYIIENYHSKIGAGIIGELDNEINSKDFLVKIKEKLNISSIRYTDLCKEKIKTVALCGGSGSFLLKNTIQQNADIFISADFKYHDFFDANNKIIIADIGHFESEKLTIELIDELLNKKFTKFAILKTQINTNPINYI